VKEFLAQTCSGEREEPFFNTLARYLSHTLDMEFVCIDFLEGDGLTARTVAVWGDGHFEDNVSYALKDTPCGDVVGKQVCCFPANVCRLFPRDQVLQDMRAESYIGVTLFGHTGQPIGLIACVGRSPLVNRPLAEAVMALVAVRAAGEMERLEAETALRKSEEKYRTLFHEMLEGCALHEIICGEEGTPVDYRFLAVNPAFERLTGLRAEKIMGRTILEVLPDTERFWIETYGKVALSGEPAFFEQDSAELNKTFEVTAFRPAPNQFCCIIADITEYKRAEEEKANLQIQLHHAQKMESVGRLAGVVAHDFNNMLGGNPRPRLSGSDGNGTLPSLPRQPGGDPQGDGTVR
jgi:PAS domain S-box-containing protein